MTVAELTVPMLVVAPTQEDAANPEVVRLVALARAGDRAAFGRLIENHLTTARRVALAAVGQISDADEAVQEGGPGSSDSVRRRLTPLIISQPADPVSDRKVVVEVHRHEVAPRTFGCDSRANPSRISSREGDP